MGALGASHWRLVRSILVDQIVLATAGGALGVALASAALRIFVTTAPISLPRVQDVVIDGRVIGFGAAVVLFAALAVAFLPAWRIGRGDLESVLRSGGRTSDRGAQRVRSMLLTAQVALSVMLLVISGLFVSSLSRVLRVDTGFAAEGAVTVEVAPVSARYPDTAARAALYDRILDRVRVMPGVTNAAWTSALPLTGETFVDQILRPDRAGEKDAKSSANYRFVGPEYFRAIGTPILQGRSIEDRDRTATPTPAVISSRTARMMWPDGDVIGREFTRSDPSHLFRVVGVVADGHATALESESPLMVYVPYWHNNEGRSVLVVRAHGDALALVATIRSAIRDVDRDIAIAKSRTAPPRHRRCRRRPPLPDDAVHGIWRHRATHRDRRRLCDDGVRRLAAATGTQHQGCTRRAGVAGVLDGAAAERRTSSRRPGRRSGRGVGDGRSHRGPALRGPAS